MAQFVVDLFSSLGNCLNCFPGSPTVRINGRSFKLLRLLGEGGFSYVYLVEDAATHALYALKKMRCPLGAESVRRALREVEAYRRFAHVPGIIDAVDHAVATERGGAGDEARTVYVLLPYYRRGNLQDLINANLVNRAAFPERRLMVLFLGVCRALAAMHHYRPPPGERMRVAEGGDADDDAAAAASSRRSRHRRTASASSSVSASSASSSAGAASASAPSQDRPLMPPASISDGSKPARARSYAHRDVKPGNIMIDDAGTAPILMDLGSAAPAPLDVPTPAAALALQDEAAEHSTMPYRAPELFDVRAGARVDARSDVWSLGCTLYACLVGKSPFELRSDETGGSLALCVLGGDWRFPDEEPAARRDGSSNNSKGNNNNNNNNNSNSSSIPRAKARAAAAAASASSSSPPPPQQQHRHSLPAASGLDDAAAAAASISEPVRDVVRRCLRVEPAERPDIDELIALVEAVIEGLPDDDGPASP